MAFTTELVALKNLPASHNILCGEEQKKYGALKFEKRRTDWLGGRVSAKRVIMKALGLGSLKYRDIEILNDVTRKPYFKVKNKIYPNALSISHCSGYAVSAVAKETDMLLGIDMEITENRSRLWMQDAFGNAELTETDDETLTRLWTCKEAVLKAMGVGLASDLHELMIIENKPVFSGTLLKIWQNKGSREIKIKTFDKPQGYVTAVAYGGF